MKNLVETDLLVIGSGLGGLWAAVTAKENGVQQVTVVDKGAIANSSQSKMSAGATIYCGPRDNCDVWFRELVEQQALLSRQDMVTDMLATSWSRLKKQEAWGLWYKRLPWGSRKLPVGGAKHLKMHPLPRYKKLGGGAALVGVVKDQAKKHHVDFLSKVMIMKLLTSEGRIAGAIGIHRVTGEVITFRARAIVLATADCSFRASGCIGQATGDGYALAYDLGIRLNNMEFWGSNTGSPEYSFEGFSDVAADNGCRFVNAEQEHFTQHYTPAGDKAEPYRIAQAMADEAAKGRAPFQFDMSGFRWRMIMNLFYKRNMHGYIVKVFDAMESYGIDPMTVPQPWTPIMRTIRGGIRTGLDCMSDLPGLFVAGTAQSLDPAGLNGYSTMRAMWSGERAGESSAAFICQVKQPIPDADLLHASQRAALMPLGRDSGLSPDEVTEKLQNTLFPAEVSLRKDETALKKALQSVESIRDKDLPQLCASDPHELVKAHETRNMVIVAELYLWASLTRQESRGDHYRADYPHTNYDHWLKWINMSKGENGHPVLEMEAVPINQYHLQLEVGEWT